MKPIKNDILHTFKISENHMRQYAKLTGDKNQLHLNEQYATARGFTGCVVYGGLILGQISQVVGMQLTERHIMWVSVDLKFRSPLYVLEEATIFGNVAACSKSTGLIKLSIKVKSGEKKIADGYVEVYCAD